MNIFRKTTSIRWWRVLLSGLLKKTSWAGFIKNFVSGILYLLPLAAVFYVVGWVFDVVALAFKAVAGSTNSYLITALVFAVSVVVIATAGRAANKYNKVKIVSFVEDTVARIPFVGSLLKTLKEIFSMFAKSKKAQSLGVVQIPYIGGSHALALVMKKEVIDYEDGERVRLTVFMPTAPNPTSGFLMFFDEREVKYVDMSADDMFKKVVSLGIA